MSCVPVCPNLSSACRRETLSRLKAQVKESYASAPQEFIDEARKADLLNEALPPLTSAEIAAEFIKVRHVSLPIHALPLCMCMLRTLPPLTPFVHSQLAESGKTVIERAARTPDFASLNPLRPRGPRPKGNKIDLKKPAPGNEEEEGTE